MKVGVNLIFLGERAGGVGRYAMELLGALAAGHPALELHAFTSRDEPAGLRTAPWASRVRFTQLPVTNAGPPLHLLASFGALPALALARRLDVLHSPANAGPTRVPRIGCVVTLHDLIWHHAGDAWGTPAAVRATRRQAAPVARHADALLADSRHAAGELVDVLGAPRERIVVSPLGVRPPASDVARTPATELRDRFGLPDGSPVVLCVAQKRPYKRQDLLVRALTSPTLRDAGARLVLPGAPTPFEAELRALSVSLGVADRVVFPDWVSDADLEGLYELATCVALPSELEGFGLPVLEAMARGVPVACSDRASLAEVAGNAAERLDIDDPSQVADALARVIGDADRRAELVRRGHERAATFTWARTADTAVEGYARAAARARGGRRLG